MTEHPVSPWHAAYNAYWETLGWPPLASGKPRPHFFDLPPSQWQAWINAVQAVVAWTRESPAGSAPDEEVAP